MIDKVASNLTFLEVIGSITISCYFLLYVGKVFINFTNKYKIE